MNKIDLQEYLRGIMVELESQNYGRAQHMLSTLVDSALPDTNVKGYKDTLEYMGEFNYGKAKDILNMMLKFAEEDVINLARKKIMEK